MSIHLTEAAAKHVHAILEKTPDAVGLRVGVKPSGCAEYSYVIGVAKAIDEQNDTIVESCGIKLVIDNKSLDKIDETEIDYEQQGLNSSIVFNNPKAEHSCGCGESFSLKDQ